MPGRPKGDPGRRSQPAARGVRAARAWADLTAQELADAIGRGIRTVQKWEAGALAPSSEAVESIAQVCGVPLWMAEGDPTIFSLLTDGRGTR